MPITILSVSCFCLIQYLTCFWCKKGGGGKEENMEEIEGNKWVVENESKREAKEWKGRRKKQEMSDRKERVRHERKKGFGDAEEGYLYVCVLFLGGLIIDTMCYHRKPSGKI